MALPPSTPARHAVRASPRAAPIGLAITLVLMAAAVLIPPVTGWNVHEYHGRQILTPPLHARWQPRVGPGTIPALLLAGAAVIVGPRLAKSMRWSRLLLMSLLVTLAWMLALALVDGTSGLTATLMHHTSYWRTAENTHDIGAALAEFIDRIPLTSAHNWPVQVAGHPPGALLVFVLLARLVGGSALAGGIVVTALAATAPVAVLVTLRTLAAEQAARRVAPILVMSPAAIWCAVSGDGLFAAIVAWSIAALAIAATRRSLAWSVIAGLLLGYCLMLSYGYVLVGLLAIAVLILAKAWSPMYAAVPAAAAVVVVFAFAGFAWWDAYPVLTQRYWAGIAHKRPASYWFWGDLAAFVFSAGPALGPAIAHAAARAHNWARPHWAKAPAVLAAAALTMVLLADASRMSKAEVERIWLPFAWWSLPACALLPRPWRHIALALQVATALLIQHLVRTSW